MLCNSIMEYNEIERTRFSWDFFCLFAFLYLLSYSNLITIEDTSQLSHPSGEYQGLEDTLQQIVNSKLNFSITGL